MLTNGRLRTLASWDGDFPTPSASPCLSLLFLIQLVVTKASLMSTLWSPSGAYQNKTGKSWLRNHQVPGPASFRMLLWFVYSNG